MGGLIGGIFDLTSGDPTANEGHQLAGLSGFETGTGEGLETAGAGFDESLLSGDPTKISSALAPEISTGQQQVEQAALGNANFGNRSGGTNAATQNAEAKNRGNIIDLEGGLQSGAASSALGAGSGLLGQASSNINDKASKVAKLKAQQRNYGVLADLNTRPRTTYIAEVFNPNPELSEARAEHAPAKS